MRSVNHRSPLRAEQSGDNVNFAVNWLVENGARELEMMANAALHASQREEEERKRLESGVAEDDLDADRWTASHCPCGHTPLTPLAPVRSDDDSKDWLSAEPVAGAEGGRRGGDRERERDEPARHQHASAYLDDEIEGMRSSARHAR